VNSFFHVFNRFVAVPTRSQAYRPEIDGLRAVAVVAVLINHLNERILPGGFLGVDIFFVISGYVVTSSLLAREDGSRWQFLARFYGRRVRRLLPALVVNIAVVSILFSMFASPLDDFYAPSMRTGTAAIFGVSNLYLLKQGTGYFAGDNRFNIFMHTWSLGVEEQFYLVWPAILLLCGLGVAGAAGGLRRLKIVSLLLVAVSLALFVGLSLKGQSERAFFLTPARFWELAAGCGAYLLHRGGGSARDLGRKLTFPGLRGPLSLVLLLAMVGLLLLPETWRIATTLAVAAITAVLLILLQPTSGVGRLLCHPVSLMLGAVSYSLYLWHWPVIVLARWTIGLTALTLLPVLALIAVCTILSYRLEGLFRYGSPTGLGHPWVLYPAMTVLASVVSLGLQGPLMGRLFAGQRSHAVGGSVNMKRIDGTTVDTVHCFQEPTDPIPKEDVLRACRADVSPGRPTLYFVGDSHTHMLIPLGGKLLASGRYNVAFLARGGCPVPDFSRWEDGAAIPARYRLCKPYADNLEQLLLDRLRPDDRIVLVSNLSGSLSNLKGPARERVEDSYANAIRRLAAAVASRGARIVILAPLPTIPQATLSGPLTLCQPEWFRPSWSQAPQCRPVQQPRGGQIAATAQVRSFLQRLVAEVPGTALFDPFDSICPPTADQCSSHLGSNLLFSDSNHLTNAGAWLLYPRFLAFLASPSPAR
jgi:peptidoglycan/LPS O-acetylase OafA/YrhL